jgi:uncharacterized protein YjbI with pentapeptide repeats
VAQEPKQEDKDTSKRTKQLRWSVTILLLLVIVGVLIYLGYGQEWTGFGESVREKATTTVDIRREKTLWDWLQLIGTLLIPIAVAGGTYMLNRAAKKREEDAQRAQKEREEDLQQQRAEDATLQAYLDYMAKRLTDPHRPLQRSHLGDKLSVAARAQTLTALGRLQDGKRKGSVVQFLYEAGLINRDYSVVSLEGADLSNANLRKPPFSKRQDLVEANLRGADLRNSDLSQVNLGNADLSNATLVGAHLTNMFLDKANLRSADLRNADLTSTTLNGADLRGAYLSKAKLEYANLAEANLASGSEMHYAWYTWLSEANLSHAYLHHASLSGAYLNNAVLRHAALSEANLTGTHLSCADLQNTKGLMQEQLEKAIGDKDTKLPEGLEPPKSWTRGEDTQADQNQQE